MPNIGLQCSQWEVFGATVNAFSLTLSELGMTRCLYHITLSELSSNTKLLWFCCISSIDTLSLLLWLGLRCLKRLWQICQQVGQRSVRASHRHKAVDWDFLVLTTGAPRQERRQVKPVRPHVPTLWPQCVRRRCQLVHLWTLFGKARDYCLCMQAQPAKKGHSPNQFVNPLPQPNSVPVQSLHLPQSSVKWEEDQFWVQADYIKLADT